MENPVNNFVLALLAYLAQRDILPEKVCRLAGIDPAWMGDKNRQLLTNKQIDDLWINSIHLSKDPDLGLHFGESLQLSALGIVGELVKSSNTVGEAVLIAADLGHLVTHWFKMRVTKEKETFTVHIDGLVDGWQNSASARQTLDVLMVLTIHELNGLMLKKIKPLKVSYNMPVTSPIEHERVLGCVPQYLSEDNSVTFDMFYWNELIITANYELQYFLKEKVRESTEKKGLEKNFGDKISHYLMSNAYLGMGSLEEIAANFNISPRTLQRRLKDEQVSFQQLADEVRQQLAVQAITQGEYTIKEIAYSLGYNELSAFSRAFKRWTGTSPEAYKVQFRTTT